MMYSYPYFDPSSYPYDVNQAGAVNYGGSNLNFSYNPFNHPYRSSGMSQNYDGYNTNLGGYDDQGVQNESGVYKYNGGKLEKGSSGDAVLFDDYVRPINGSVGNKKIVKKKIVKDVRKVLKQQDVKGSVQKVRVQLLWEGVSQNDMDVLCQVMKP